MKYFIFSYNQIKKDNLTNNPHLEYNMKIYNKNAIGSWINCKKHSFLPVENNKIWGNKINDEYIFRLPVNVLSRLHKLFYEMDQS